MSHEPLNNNKTKNKYNETDMNASKYMNIYINLLTKVCIYYFKKVS